MTKQDQPSVARYPLSRRINGVVAVAGALLLVAWALAFSRHVGNDALGWLIVAAATSVALVVVVEAWWRSSARFLLDDQSLSVRAFGGRYEKSLRLDDLVEVRGDPTQPLAGFVLTASTGTTITVPGMVASEPFSVRLSAVVGRMPHLAGQLSATRWRRSTGRVAMLTVGLVALLALSTFRVKGGFDEVSLRLGSSAVEVEALVLSRSRGVVRLNYTLSQTSHSASVACGLLQCFAWPRAGQTLEVLVSAAGADVVVPVEPPGGWLLWLVDLILFALPIFAAPWLLRSLRAR